MTKKRIMMAAMSAGLVGVVGIGGTLAYLSATDGPVKNTFTVGKGYIPDDKGHTGLYLDETEYTYNPDIKKNVETGERTEQGNKYENLYPGNSFIKDPKVTMVGGSVESYVFVKVEGVEGLEKIIEPETENQVFDIKDWSTSSWIKLDEEGKFIVDGEGDGYYVYAGQLATDFVVDVSTKTEKEPVQLPEAVFNTIAINDVDVLPDNADVTAEAVTVKACAVQATDTRQGVEVAFAQAKGELDKIEN